MATPGSAQYVVTNLVSNQNAIGSNLADPDLVNAWGVTSLAASPFWVSDNRTGKSTLYNSLGQKQGLVVTIPSVNGTGQGTPTGVIGNTTASSFVVSFSEGGVTKSGILRKESQRIVQPFPAAPSPAEALALARSSQITSNLLFYPVSDVGERETRKTL